METIQVVSGRFGLLNGAFTLVLFLAGVWIALIIVRKSYFDILATTNAALKTSNEANLALIKQLQQANEAQEKRIVRVELDADRKSRFVARAREEIRFLESMIRIAIPFMAKSVPPNPEYERVMKIFQELEDFRLRDDREQEEWDATRDVTTAWLTSHGRKDA